MRSFTAAIENNAPAPSIVCIPPEEMKHTTGSCRSAQTTSSLQNFSALAMSKAPALKAVLEITAPTLTPSSPLRKRPMPVTTPQGGWPLCSAFSMESRKPGKRCGSELMRSPLSSWKSSKKWATKALGSSFAARLLLCSTSRICKSRYACIKRFQKSLRRPMLRGAMRPS